MNGLEPCVGKLQGRTSPEQSALVFLDRGVLANWFDFIDSVHCWIAKVGLPKANLSTVRKSIMHGSIYDFACRTEMMQYAVTNNMGNIVLFAIIGKLIRICYIKIVE